MTTMVALEDGTVVGFAYLQSDAEIQAHLSELAVSRDHRRRGIDHVPLEQAMPLTGAQRIDLPTDTVKKFHNSFTHRTSSGFRIYPGVPVPRSAWR